MLIRYIPRGDIRYTACKNIIAIILGNGLCQGSIELMIGIQRFIPGEEPQYLV